MAAVQTFKLDVAKMAEKDEDGLSKRSQERDDYLFFRIRELEAEAEIRKQSALKTIDLFSTQTTQLEQTKILLEESKLQIVSLQEKVKKLENSSSGSHQKRDSVADEAKHLPKEDVDRRSRASENFGKMKVKKSVADEMEKLRNELKSAIDAEENSRKAMDDLASALKEVATESNQYKQKLKATELELNFMKEEADQLKSMMRTTENKYKQLLEESRREIELLKGEGERLRFEAEESISTWNGKELGFVECIKIAEEDRFAAQKENRRLVESLRSAESKIIKSKEENQQLRDILKQALNEANAAKEAAEIAKAENSQLKDAISDKENELSQLKLECENQKINEAAALENLQQSKRSLSAESESKETKKDYTDQRKLKTHLSMEEERNGSKKVSQIFSFNLKELKLSDRHRDQEEELDIDDALKGSIFDDVNSPISATNYPKKKFSPLIDDGEALSLDDLDGEGDKSSRKKRVLLRRFADILRRKNLHRKETSLD